METPLTNQNLILKAKKEVFKDIDNYLDEVDTRIGHLIVSHGIDLSDIHPNYKELKEVHLSKQ